MFSFEYDTSTVGFENEASVRAEADDLEGLLVAWLSELVWFHDTESLVLGDFIVTEIGEPPIRREGTPKLMVAATVRGRYIGDWFVQTGPQIKAVTFHGLEVKQRRGGWEATAYLDV